MYLQKQVRNQCGLGDCDKRETVMHAYTTFQEAMTYRCDILLARSIKLARCSGGTGKAATLVKNRSGGGLRISGRNQIKERSRGVQAVQIEREERDSGDGLCQNATEVNAVVTESSLVSLPPVLSYPVYLVTRRSWKVSSPDSFVYPE